MPRCNDRSSGRTEAVEVAVAKHWRSTHEDRVDLQPVRHIGSNGCVRDRPVVVAVAAGFEITPVKRPAIPTGACPSGLPVACVLIREADLPGR